MSISHNRFTLISMAFEKMAFEKMAFEEQV